jgi:hypothetical protein
VIVPSFLARVVFAGTFESVKAGPSGVFDIGAVELRILRPDNQPIGFTRFAVSRDHSIAKVEGTSTYADGQRDNETEVLHWSAGESFPRLGAYEHNFFGSDGSLRMLDTLDAASGTASCMTTTGDGTRVRRARLDVPADTFAGGSDLLVVAAGLRRGIRRIKFHAFACVPGPHIFAVEASFPERSEKWPLYPGNLARLDLRPDLGILNFAIAPFMPRMDAWFDPNDNWNYVGGEFDRYFRGPHVLTVRVEPAH